ncbi:hypothetical protein ACFXAF_00230 [Kitasatospora sp. NPDC059463]|uniref:hypothetical protein n=1 Tax=Kitasatospora sp. NPDC059463 TaxID=3346842 RepID=UPI00369DE444
MTVLVCNKCEQLGKPVRSYTIAEGDRKRRVDLCEDDGRLVEELMATGEPVEQEPASSDAAQAPARKAAPAKKAASAKKTSGAKGAARKSARRGAQTLTLEEIEALRFKE